MNYPDKLLELKELIIEFGEKEETLKEVIFKLDYIVEDYFFTYNSSTKEIFLYNKDKIYRKIGQFFKDISILADITPDILVFYTEVLKKNLGLNYNLESIL